jgi:hypothetical protein
VSIVAIIPAANLAAANAALAAWGVGIHFTVSGLGAAGLTHGALHDWGTNPAYVAAIKARPGVIWDEGAGDPATRLRALLAGVSAQSPVDAVPLPASGNTVAGALYTFNNGAELWRSLVAFSRTTFSGPPSGLAPSIIRRRRWPGDILPWVQPIDGFDAYRLVDSITGQPDRCIFGGRQYRVAPGGVDGAGNNVWPPSGVGAFGWTDEGPAA